MKPIDLRIGNYLQDGKTKEILKVKKLTWAEILTEVVDRSKYPLDDGWFLEPIPLSNEWLKKLGFVWLDETDPYCYKDELMIDSNGYITWHGLFLHDIKIEYVHDLQNLFYTLKKVELI